MRSLPLVLLAAAVAACAPRGDDAPATDTASAMDSTAAAATPVDTARAGRAARDTAAASASPGLVLPAPQGATPRRDAPITARGETSMTPAPRIKPPTKAPGGYIMVPQSAHDSLRLAKPDSARRP
jgi:hypothetical protein